MKGKLFYNILIILILTIIILLIVKYRIESIHQNDYDKLITSYYQEQSTTETIITDNITQNNVGLYNIDYSENTASTNNVFYHDSVDSILRVDAHNIILPVCIGNFKADMEAYRLSVFSNFMELGNTTYTIMGHHSIALDIAFGWLDKVELGTIVELEKDSVTYTYKVTEITVDYATEMTHVFSLDYEDVVYLVTCDYSLGNSERIIYRVVKCERCS